MIVSCGEALVDMVPHAVPGGGPMNVAIAAARLGAPAAFVGCISTDEYGKQITDHLTTNGVDLSAAQTSDQPTARAIIEHKPQLVFRFEGTDTADTMLGPVDLSVLGPDGGDNNTGFLHGGTLGLFRGRTADTLADLAGTYRGIVSLDPNIRPQVIEDRDHWDQYHNRWMPRSDVYKGSDEDMEWIWPGRSADGCVEALHAAGVTAVVVTRGSDGLSIITPSVSVTVAAPSVEVIDTVGAGDTTVAAILVGLLERGITKPGADKPATADGPTLADLTAEDWQAVAAGATEAAAITCSRAGANPPLRSELSW